MREGELGRLYSHGEIIFREGEKGDVMYVIQSGKVKISKNSSSGDITMATLTSGDIFGEMALFDKLPRSASAVAEGDTRVLSIDKKKLFSTIWKDPTVVLKVIETMSGTIRRLSKDFAELKKRKQNITIINSGKQGVGLGDRSSGQKMVPSEFSLLFCMLSTD